MHSFIGRPPRRAAIITGAAGLAVVGAVGLGTAAFADGTTPSPGASHAAPAPSGAPGRGPGRTHTPHIGGTVLSVDGTTVTVKDPEGFTRTIRLQAGVTVTKGTAASTTAAITKGTWIEASGAVDANGTALDATTVSIGRPTPPKGGPHGGPAGGRGERPAPPAGDVAAPTPPPTAS